MRAQHAAMSDLGKALCHKVSSLSIRLLERPHGFGQQRISFPENK